MQCLEFGFPTSSIVKPVSPVANGCVLVTMLGQHKLSRSPVGSVMSLLARDTITEQGSLRTLGMLDPEATGWGTLPMKKQNYDITIRAEKIRRNSQGRPSAAFSRAKYMDKQQG